MNGTIERYSLPARCFHWLTVLLLAAQFAVAWTMPDVHRDTKPIGLIALHLSLGVLILLVMLARLAYRLATPKVAPLPTTPPLINRLAHIGHGTLYLLLIVLPLLGWANASSRGWDVSLFGLLPLPALSPTGSQLGHAMGDIHQLIAWVLLAVAGLHVGAALYHHFVLRDATLSRMLPQGSDKK
ncbi:MAG: cytochrome b [Burkholderiales bacterium]|nr:cytochrome b [Burkholderiales bacterium]